MEPIQLHPLALKRYAANLVWAAALSVVTPLFAASSSTVLAVSPTPAVFAAPATMIATVSPSAATGSITFYDGANFLGKTALANGSASFTTRNLSAGTHQLTAYYSGNSSLNPARLPRSICK